MRLGLNFYRFFTILFCSLSFPALTAPLTAPWLAKIFGEGEARFASGSVYQCTEIFLDHSLQIQKRADGQETLILRRAPGYYDCGLLKAEYPAYEMEIDAEGRLFDEENVLRGSIDELELKLEFESIEEDFRYEFRLFHDVEAELVRLHELWYSPIGATQPSLELKGTFH